MSLSTHSLSLAGRAFYRSLGTAIGKLAFDPLPGFVGDSGGPTIPGRSAHFDIETLGRVVSCGFGLTLADQRARLDRTDLPVRPLRRLRLGPATVVGGQIFSAGKRHFMSNLPPRPTPFMDIEHIDGPVHLLNSQQGLKYFGHWLRDDCAAYEALEDLDGRLISMRRPDWVDTTLYESLFEQVWEEKASFRCSDLTITRDLGFSEDKRNRLTRLRTRLRSKITGANPGQIVYLKRDHRDPVRRILNEDALIDVLTARGVHILEPETGTRDLVETLLDAAVVITIEGSQAAHAVYTLADRGALLVMQPPRRFYNPHLDWAQLLGMDYGIVIGEDGAGGCHIHPDEVLAMIDRLLTAGAAQNI